MLFNSAAFLIFFPVVTFLYFLLPFKIRWFWLLSASCFFYMFFKPEYILILFFTIIIDFYAGLWLEKITDLNKRKRFLILSIIANVGVLAVFKYYNFLNDNITGLALWLGFKNPIPYLDMILPIGLSFHTFQAMSYTIEVYRGNQKAEKHFGIYALYVMFYPQLVAGPIERPQNILHQFYKKHLFDTQKAVEGLTLMLYGFFKKLVVADRLAVYVNQVYGDIEHASSISVALACIFFSFQIYCDFSGYTDIARGAARMMGYELMLNFNRPYLATSIANFWSRWHISLSTWFRDYLYIPLGGNRCSKIKWYRNLSVVFLVSGLWHGANWTFVVWGALHACYTIFELVTKNTRIRFWQSIGLYQTKIMHACSVLFVFIAVTFAWIFFRAENISQAWQVIHKLLAFDFTLNMAQLTAEKGPLNLALCFLSIVLLLLSYKLPINLKIKYPVSFACITIFIILLLGKNGSAEFIYFQF
ncbi:MAG: MBOAT family protein [Bacteroidia bacterium]|nr:MBOAT family protein [Bacteroidia bacterium]